MAKQKAKVQAVEEVKVKARGKNRDSKALMKLSLKLGDARAARAKSFSAAV